MFLADKAKVQNKARRLILGYLPETSKLNAYREDDN